jgi:alanine racemase
MRGIILQGLFTHYAVAEDNSAYTLGQARRLEKVLKPSQEAGIQISDVHTSNSAGILHQPDCMFNMVRPGLLVYGVVPPGRRRLRSDFQQKLRPALSLKCRVGFVKTVRRCTPLSYGHTVSTCKRTRVATITAGYGDGYLRAGSNRAQVLVNGVRCPVLGVITMDQMLVDVSRAGSVSAGDEVALIGRQRREGITATEVAGWCGTVPWEVLTNISHRVPRIYRGGTAA